MKFRRFTGLIVAAVALAGVGCERETSTVAYDAPERPTGAVSHSISGTVTQIDNTGGLLTLRSDTATLRLPFNPATMGELTDGEPITARLTITKAPSEPRGQAFDAPIPRYVPDGALPTGEDQVGQRSITGTAKDIDHGKGTFTLQSDAGPLTVYFPPAGIAELKDGDRITLYAVFTRES